MPSVKQARSFSKFDKHGDNSIPASKLKYIPTSGTYPRGFLAGSTHVGIKASRTSREDLAFVVSEKLASGAAVFTKNKFLAAPVTVSRDLLHKRAGRGIRGVIVNSWCANAVTGNAGLQDAYAMSQETDKCFTGQDDSDGQCPRTIVMSTGVIGQRLPIDKILNKIPDVRRKIGQSHEHWLSAASAICTTDTFPKLASRSFTLPSSPGITYSLAGMTKGAGMIHPNMATLLGIICTDANINPRALHQLLTHATQKSFNSISVDGDMSTNDTVAILANGAASGPEIQYRQDSLSQSPDYIAFQEILTQFATDLAKLIVRDGEGATKFVTIRVTDSPSYAAAKQIASTIARSPLVKTALYGRDANWGRILCALGYSLIDSQFDEQGVVVPNMTSVSFVPADGSAHLKLLVRGEPEIMDEERASQILEGEDLEILVQLRDGTGGEEAVYWTCDLSHEYVTINGDYRT